MRCLRVMPAVVVTGARQTGKSTLARNLLSDQRRYSPDDLDVEVADTAGPATERSQPAAPSSRTIRRAFTAACPRVQLLNIPNSRRVS